jgi:hypothetical protein
MVRRLLRKIILWALWGTEEERQETDKTLSEWLNGPED